MSPPSRYVQPAVDEARIERVWHGVEHGLARRTPRSLRWFVASAALCSAGALGALWWRSAPSETSVADSALLAGARLETAGDALAVSLNDGSALRLAARSQVIVQGNQPAVVALALATGELSCDVVHRPGRAFTVVAADVEVRVVGTQFTVKATPQDGGTRVEVAVRRGVVEVRSGRDPGAVTRVSAGQSWSQSPPLAASLTTSSPASSSEPSGASIPTKDEVRSPPVASGIGVAPAGPSARELFEKAGERRRAGDAAAAAHAYEELLKVHPGDARASLAAFELGRLRMDRLGDQRGAVAALERAVALNVGPSFREDALARLVSVYAAQGNFAACARARERYLQSYPSGVHATAVSSRCGTR